MLELRDHDLVITISGYRKSGKSIAASTIRILLRERGANATIENGADFLLSLTQEEMQALTNKSILIRTENVNLPGEE